MTAVSKKLFKGSVLRSFTLVVNIIVGFFMMPFLIHSLGNDQYGLWVLVGAVIGFYGLLDAGFGSAIIRFIVRAIHSEDNEKEVNVALSTSIFLFSGIGLLSLLITFIIILLVPHFADSSTNESLAQILIGILGLKVSVLFPMTSFSGVLMAKYRFDILSYIRLSSLVFRTSLIVLFVNFGYDIISVAIVTSIDALVVSISTVYLAKKFFPELRVSASYVSFDKLKKYYHYGKYTYITSIADKIRFSIDDLVVAAYVGIGAVTHYTIAVALIRYFGELMDGVLGVLNPLFNKYHKLNQWDELRDVFLLATEISAMMSVLIGGLLIVLGEPFLVVWMGEEYKDVYTLLLILCVAFTIAQAQRPCVSVLYAIAKHKYFAKITGIEAVANICISIILVQYIGIYGVAFGTAIPMIFNKLLLQPIYTCKQLDISLKQYSYRILKYPIAGVTLFLPAIIFKEYIDLDSYLKLTAAGFFLSSIYIVVIMKFITSHKVKEYIMNVIPDRIKPFLRLVF